jgi:hypothetical protein
MSNPVASSLNRTLGEWTKVPTVRLSTVMRIEKPKCPAWFVRMLSLQTSVYGHNPDTHAQHQVAPVEMAASHVLDR